MQPGGPSPTERQAIATSVSNFLLQAFHDSRRNGRAFGILRNLKTQYHKATLDADFKRVFDAAQSFSRDVSKIANEAADMAPTLLPNIANLSDIARKSRVSEADLAAVSKAVFEGTLADTDPGKGKVWTDAELRARGLNEQQIALYHEFRAAVTKSLDDFGKSELLRFATGQVPEDLRNAVLEANDVKAAAELLADALGQKLAHVEGSEKRESEHQIEELQHLIDDLREKAQRVQDLKDNGYAPLMRFGQYAVWIQHEETIESEDGEKTVMVTDWFSTHESLREANQTAREMMPEIKSGQPGAILKQGIMSKEEHKLFAGVTPDTLEVFGAAAGFDGTPEWKAYIELVKNNRSALKRMLERKGTPGFSQDLSRVLAGFITSNARASAGNIHSGEMIKAVEAIPKGKGDVKDEAVRLVEYLRDGAEEAARLRGLMFNWFLGGSIASAAVNLTQPLTMTLPYLAVKESAAKATARLTTAVKDVLAGRYEKDLAEALQLGEKEGVVEPQEMHALQAEVSRNLGSNLKLRKFLFAWGYLFQAAERFNRRTTFVAAYRQARDLKVADPFAFAEEAVIETQGVYAKHNRPNWARGAVGATLFTFKQYSIAYIEFVARLLKNKESRPAGMLAIGILIALSGVSGFPGAEDLDDIIDTLAQAAGYNFQADEAKREFLAAILGEPAAEFMLRGVSSTGIPIDIQQRLGLGNLIPGTGAFKKSSPSPAREAIEVFGAAGGLGQKVGQAITAGLAGDGKGAGRSLLPVAFENAYKAMEMWQTGQYRDTKGRRVTDVQMSDAIWKGIGFQPADVGKINRREGDILASARITRQTEAEIAGKWAQGLFEHDDAKVQAAREALWSWNQKNRDTPIKITGQQLKQRVKQMQMTRAERIVKSSPKELRQMAARSLQESR